MENHNIYTIWWGLVQQTMQCEQINNFRKWIPYNTIRHVLYSHTRCLGLHSKMCAPQMNTSDIPELWDIQLSSWLFCELTRQLCPCLLSSSCDFFALHTMHADVLQALAGRLPVTKPGTSDQRLGRLPVPYTAYVCISQHAQSLSQANIHWQVDSDLRSLPVATSRTGHTYSVTSYTHRWSLHTMPPVLVTQCFTLTSEASQLSADYFFELSRHSQFNDCRKTSLQQATPKTSSHDRANNFRQPWVKLTLPL